MSYEILGSKGQYWTCQQGAWSDYLKLAAAFGWAPEGAFFRDDERGFGPHASGSYIGNDWQQVGDDDAAPGHCYHQRPLAHDRRPSDGA
jgi:hypothetical protein